MRRRVVSSVLLAGLLMGAVPAWAAPRGDTCTFSLGFATLAGLIPEQVGACISDVTYSGRTGDAVQETTGGLLAWRKADNWTAFTDGTSTWINGPEGLQSRPNDARFPWEADAGSYAPAGAATADAALLPEDLLAAAPAVGDVESVFPGGEHGWWQAFPAFYVPPHATPTNYPGERFVVEQSFERPGADAGPLYVLATLGLFETPEQAAATFAAQAATGAAMEPIDGPAIGEQAAYWRQPAAGEQPARTSVMVQHGPALVRLRMATQDGFAATEDLARLAQLTDERVAALLAGNLSRAPLPTDLANQLPVAAAGVGPLVGSATTSPAAWALLDFGGNPGKALGTLRALGADHLVTRHYALEADADHLVELTLFPLRDEQAAITWFDDFRVNVDPATTLPAGQTGPHALFAHSTDPQDNYELQFARGRYVADIFCYPRSGDTSPACEDAVRSLAEQLYERLAD